MAIQWTVNLRLSNGAVVVEPQDDENAADARITVLKNPSSSINGWLEFDGKHIRMDHVFSLEKTKRGKADPPPE